MAKNIAAMILAGGKGTRLEALTEKIAKPAVNFGGKYRIIDFPLSNCANSGITKVGVLTQYESTILDEYIGNGEKWGLNGVGSLTTTLAPRQTEKGMSWYKGTANAIYENLDFLEQVNVDYVLVLSGDHIYSTTYNEMLATHISKKADLTIAVYQVPLKEASRFGILVANEESVITEFQEKPAHPTSNLASMGIYIFSFKVLKKALIEDAKNENSSHDFGKDVIPMLLNQGKRLVAYKYKGYWKDVGTVSSLHEANMDLLPSSKDVSLEKIFAGNTIYTEDANSVPQLISSTGSAVDSLVNQGSLICGKVNHSVISSGVFVAKNAIVQNSVIMTGAKVLESAVVKNAVVAPDAIVKKGMRVVGKTDNIKLYAEKE